MTSILVLHPGSVGDTILALPVLDALKSRLHATLLHVGGHPGLVELLPGRSQVDAMTSIDGPEYRALFSAVEMPRAVSKFFQQFQVVVAWSADRDDSIKTALRSVRGVHVIVRSPGLSDKTDLHATDRFGATLGDLLPSEPLREATLQATDSDRRAGARWLARHGINKGDHLIAVHAGSGSPTKCWSSERFARVIDGLHKSGLKVVLIEGPADTQSTEAVMKQSSSASPRLRDVTLVSVVGVLSQCNAFLGNDSGLTHVAAALGLPTVAVFGPTDPAIWGSRRKNLVALRAESGCRCPTRQTQAACSDRTCFGSTPEIVLSTLQRLLTNAPVRLAS